MAEGSAREPLPRRVITWAIAWVGAAALYLLLIDITDLPELIVGAGAAVLAATGFELAREQGAADALPGRLRWLRCAHRSVLKAPADIAFVSVAAIRQLSDPRPSVGKFRTTRFRCGDGEAVDAGRMALSESLGSFAPNTIIIGVDADRQLLLAHQLRESGGAEALDLLELG